MRGLRLRFAALGFSLSGAVLAAAAILLLRASERQVVFQNDALFENQTTAIVRQLQTGDAVRSVWLAQTETANWMLIHIENNGKPFAFSGAWTPRTERDLLFARARERAMAEYGLDTGAPPASALSPTQAVFPVEGDAGERYRAAVTLIPAGKSWFSLTVLADGRGEAAQVRSLRAAVLLIGLAGLLLLGLLSYLFAGRVTQPVRRAFESQTAFVAAASHELRAPLAVIRTRAAAIRVEPERLERHLESVERECARMGRLVDDLLLLAHADAGGSAYHQERVELDALLLDAAEDFAPLAREHQCELLVEFGSDTLPPVTGDAQRLYQLAAILLDNAIRHAGGGPILLRAAGEKRRVTLECIDHGRGIPEEAKAHVFERFYRGDRSRTGREHFGLGLSVAREIVRQHGGTLSLADTPGGGCTFCVTLWAADL